jgi:hypothetical protein
MNVATQYSGTMAAGEVHRFDAAPLEGWIAVPGFRGPLAVEQFEGGR